MLTIYYAETRNDPKNCRYPNRLTGLSDEALKEAISHDYVCAEYKGNYRNASNFIRSTCLAFDVDNDHSDDPADWLTPEDLRDPFKGVEMIIHFSRSHMKAKNGRMATKTTSSASAERSTGQQKDPVIWQMCPVWMRI